MSDAPPTEPPQPASTASTDTLPQQLGRYQLQKRLGVGGMAEVFLAQRDGPAGFRKLVVVKRILPHLVEDPRFVRMFQREANVAAMLSHTNIVQVYELGVDDGIYFIAMEYVDGIALHDLARRAWRNGKSLPIEVVCCAAADAALGLQAAHTQVGADGAPLHLVHRDISPDNLIVNREGVTKILDFGVAKSAASTERTATGELKGKLPYLSPEQMRGDDVDGRADLYGLGVTLYWLLTGKRPFSASSDLKLMEQVMTQAAAPPIELNPSIPQGLNDLVLQLLEKDREKRPQSGAAVYEILQSAVSARRSLVVPFVEEQLNLPADSAQAEVPTMGVGFRPAMPQTDLLRAGWKRLGDIEPIRAAPTAPVTRVAPRRRWPFVAAGGIVASVIAAVAWSAPGSPPPPPPEPPESSPVVASAPSAPSPPSASPPPLSSAAVISLRDVVVAGPKGIVWMSENGKVLGRGAGTLQVPPSIKRIIAVNPARGVRTVVDVSRGTFDYATLPHGMLLARAMPFAEVFLGNDSLGTTPLAPVDVVAGTYDVRLRYEHTDKHVSVEVKADATARVLADFTKH